MAKDPAFLFYPNDWLGGTLGMTFEEKGAYMELLMLQFNRGHMTSHMIGQTVGQIWDKIQDKFEVDENGKYFNSRLESEQIKRKAFTESRRNNKLGNNQYTKKDKKTNNMSGHMSCHMENENENINKGLKDKDIDWSDFSLRTFSRTLKHPEIEYLNDLLNNFTYDEIFNCAKKCVVKGWRKIEMVGEGLRNPSLFDNNFNSDKLYSYKDINDEAFKNGIKTSEYRESNFIEVEKGKYKRK